MSAPQTTPPPAAIPQEDVERMLKAHMEIADNLLRALKPMVLLGHNTLCRFCECRSWALGRKDSPEGTPGYGLVDVLQAARWEPKDAETMCRDWNALHPDIPVEPIYWRDAYQDALEIQSDILERLSDYYAKTYPGAANPCNNRKES